jgi:signal transduction histidine kinase/CheY-like chemotaxis protein
MPSAPQAVSIGRVSSTRRVWLNGELIEDTTALGQGHPVSMVLGLPHAHLRAGDNEIRIDVQHRLQDGLTRMRVGDKAVLQREAGRQELLTRELPRSLNMGVALLALLMLLVSWRRPAERSMGLFGALALLGSFRNYSYFMQVSLLSAPLADALFFCAQVGTILLFVTFALSLHPHRRRGWPDRALLWAALATPLVAAIGTPLDTLNHLRTVVYPVLLLLGVTAIVILWRAVGRERTPINLALVSGFVALMVAGAHDYLFQQGHLPITDFFWVPYAMPVAFGVYGLMQMNRFVRAMNEVEKLNLELEQRVRQRTQALQAANAAKTRFLAAASHDLRQPVAAIGLMVSLLREQVVTPALRRLADRMDSALASMETLLAGLLDLSRLESGTAAARVEPVALQPLFDAIASHAGDEATRQGLRLRFRPTRLVVRTDPVLLEQILRNLVSNALRHTERGGVLVAARVRGSQVRLEVWDTGVGISEADQARIFEEFVQLGNPARDGAKGFGLGLSIVRRAAALLGHSIGLRSRPGRGTCFVLQLPREATAPPRPARRTPPERPLAGWRLVLVEDDATLRESTAQRLQAWGAEVRAYDGVPALRAALQQTGSPGDRPEDGSPRFADLVITDQRLPGGSGLEVIELVRRHCGPTPAMVVTGDTSPGDLDLLQGSGVPVLHKPFRPQRLLEAIEQARG